MAILQRGNENWTALEALIERVGTANVLYAIAAINRDNLGKSTHPDVIPRACKICGIVEKAANEAGRADIAARCNAR